MPLLVVTGFLAVPNIISAPLWYAIVVVGFLAMPASLQNFEG
jgi:uncharacterized protein (DUF983 family)